MMPIPTDQNSRGHRHAVGNGGVRPAIRLIRPFEHKTGVVMAEKPLPLRDVDHRGRLITLKRGAHSQYCYQRTRHYLHSTQIHPA